MPCLPTNDLTVIMEVTCSAAVFLIWDMLLNLGDEVGPCFSIRCVQRGTDYGLFDCSIGRVYMAASLYSPIKTMEVLTGHAA